MVHLTHKQDRYSVGIFWLKPIQTETHKSGWQGDCLVSCAISNPQGTPVGGGEGTLHISHEAPHLSFQGVCFPLPHHNNHFPWLLRLFVPKHAPQLTFSSSLRPFQNSTCSITRMLVTVQNRPICSKGMVETMQQTLQTLEPCHLDCGGNPIAS